MPRKPKVEVIKTLVDAHAVMSGSMRVDCSDNEYGCLTIEDTSNGSELLLSVDDMFDLDAVTSKVARLLRDRGHEYGGGEED